MMPRARTLVCAVVACGFAVAVGCGGRRPTPPAGLNEVQTAGWQAYIDLNCASCHGEEREGQRSGPVLAGLAEQWTADSLVAYLTDPDAVVKATPRLAYKAEKYSIGMPSASAKSPGYAAKAREEKLEALAEYLLVDP
jgi:mono/diheme cytochrome c family protein